MCAVSLDFFDDVYIPSYSLQVWRPLVNRTKECRLITFFLQIPSDYNDRKWMWHYAEGESFTTEVGDKVFHFVFYTDVFLLGVTYICL